MKVILFFIYSGYNFITLVNLLKRLYEKDNPKYVFSPHKQQVGTLIYTTCTKI